MFTVEVRINGTMIAHIYGRNTGERDKTGATVYTADFYQPEVGSMTFPVVHDANDGINALVSKILCEADRTRRRQ